MPIREDLENSHRKACQAIGRLSLTLEKGTLKLAMLQESYRLLGESTSNLKKAIDAIEKQG